MWICLLILGSFAALLQEDLFKLLARWKSAKVSSKLPANRLHGSVEPTELTRLLVPNPRPTYGWPKSAMGTSCCGRPTWDLRLKGVPLKTLASWTRGKLWTNRSRTLQLPQKDTHTSSTASFNRALLSAFPGGGGGCEPGA